MSKGQSKELVRGSVEEILNELPEAAVASIQEQNRKKQRDFLMNKWTRL